MKVVLYLSGKKKTRQFHAEQDSIAGSVTIPQSMEKEFLEILDMTGAVEGPYDREVAYDEQLPTIELEALADCFEDWKDEKALGYKTNPLVALASKVEKLLYNECSCGVYHFVR